MMEAVETSGEQPSGKQHGSVNQHSSHSLPGEGQRLEKMQGHWVLARAGKRVLRPGGIALTRRMVEALTVSPSDRVVEFAPGMGVTARMVLRHKPLAYWGVERDQTAASRLEARLPQGVARILQAHAEHTGLPDACASVAYGEAMLSMQGSEQKKHIFSEASRLLAPGGRYGIHELCFRPEGISDSLRREIEAEMSKEIHVGVQPLCRSEWVKLFEQHGLKVLWSGESDLDLLEPRRMLQDEGVLRCLKIAFSMASNRRLRRRVMGIRDIFRKYREHLGAISIVGLREEGDAGDAQPHSAPEAVLSMA